MISSSRVGEPISEMFLRTGMSCEAESEQERTDSGDPFLSRRCDVLLIELGVAFHFGEGNDLESVLFVERVIVESASEGESFVGVLESDEDVSLGLFI